MYKTNARGVFPVLTTLIQNREALFSPLDSLPHPTFCHANLQEKFGRMM